MRGRTDTPVPGLNKYRLYYPHQIAQMLAVARSRAKRTQRDVFLYHDGEGGRFLSTYPEGKLGGYHIHGVVHPNGEQSSIAHNN